MIESVSDLLTKFIDAERRRLDEFHLNHGPTIGAMYEGLTADVLGKAIPLELNLHVVSGFVTDDSGGLSSEIDCMLVKGNGEEIPYTTSYKWPIKDVIAVLEVKKKLYSREIADSFEKLRTVIERHRHYIQSIRSNKTVNISSSQRAFAETTGSIAPSLADASDLPFEKEMIYHTLVLEQISPIRIVLGYDGFKSEYSLREGLFKYLNQHTGERGWGVHSVPQLMICGNFSLAKMNGQPFNAPMKDDWWPFITSSSTPPVRFLLEYIWTRLSRDYSLTGLWGEDLQLEEVHPCLSTKAVKTGNITGWEYKYVPLSREALKTAGKMVPWEPVTVTEQQFAIFHLLCEGVEKRITDQELIEYLTSSGQNIEDFVESLLSTGMVALDGEILCLTTNKCECMVLPDGRYIVAENNSGRLTRWLGHYMKKRKDQIQNTSTQQSTEK